MKIDNLNKEIKQLKSDYDHDKKRLLNIEKELEAKKLKHREEIESYIKRLKDNDKLIMDKLGQFDTDKTEFYKQLDEIKENLKLSNESQIELEKSEYKLKSEEMERIKLKNDKMFKNFQDLIEKTQRNMDATTEKSRNSISAKEKDIEKLKNTIEEYKFKIDQTETKNNQIYEEHQNSIKSLE